MNQAPLPSFHFQAEWAGSRIEFSKIRNLAMNTEIVEIRSGSDRENSPHKTVGQQNYENFFLERPVVKGDNEFFQWWEEAHNFSITNSGSLRRDITISLLNSNHEPVVVWRIQNAMPARLTWSDLDGKGSELLYEILEISCDKIIVLNE